MYDIDLVWHTHQLNPKAYHKDMNTMLGYVMTHDDSDQDRKTGSKLNNVSHVYISDLLPLMPLNTQNLLRKSAVVDQSTSYQTDLRSINSKLCFQTSGFSSLPYHWCRDLFMCGTVHIRRCNVKYHWKVQELGITDMWRETTAKKIQAPILLYLILFMHAP